MGNTLDPSIISSAMNLIAQNDGPQQMQGWLAARNSMLQNKQMQAKQAAGQDFQKSINPLTGQVDYGKFNALLGGDPRAAFAAQDSSQAGLTNQGAQQANLQAEAQTYLDRHTVLSGMAASWMQKPNLSRSDVMDGVADAISQGIIDAPTGANIMKSYDPSNPQAWAKNEFDALTAQAGQVKALLPQYSAIDTGAATNLVNTNPLAGPPQVMGSLPNTLSPAQAAAPVNITTAGGNQQMPLGQYASERGNGNLLAGGGGGMGSGYAAGSPGSPAASQPLAAAQPTAESPMPGWNGIAYPAWAKPGNTYIPAGLDTEQGVGADMYKADVGKIGNAAQQVNQLQSIVAESGNANTGALANFFENAGSTAQQLGLTNGQQATDLQLVQKNVSQLVTGQLGGLGVPTNDKMNEVIYGTPNATMTPDAIKGAASQLLGAVKWKQAEMDAFQSYQQAAAQAGYPISAGAYAQFNAQWQKKIPVAAFQLQDMPPSLRAQYLKSIGKDQAQAIYNAMTKTIPAMGLSSGG